MSTEAFEDLNFDIVYGNGTFFRHPRVPADEVKRLDAKQAEEKRTNPREYTMKTMNTLGTAVAAWSINHDDVYPAARPIHELDALIEPYYIRETPHSDGWGTPFAYHVSVDRKNIRFISAGPDKVLEPSSRYSDDIILENFTFVKPGESKIDWSKTRP